LLFAGTGLFGGLTFIFLCCITINFFYKSVMIFANSNQKYLCNLSIILLSAFIAILLTGAGTYVIDQRIFWIYIAFSVVLFRWGKSQIDITKTVQQTGKNLNFDQLQTSTTT